MFNKLPKYWSGFLLLSILVVILLSSYLLRIYSYENKPAGNLAKELQCGDSFPKKAALFSSTGKKVALNELIKERNLVIFYLDSAKSDSIARLLSISKIIKLFPPSNISYMILWQNEIPVAKLKSSDIAQNINFSLRNRYIVSQTTPNAFIIDQKGKVILVSGYSYFTLITKVHELSGNTDLRQKVNEMVVQDATRAKDSQFSTNKPYLLMFVTSGCRLCKESDRIIREQMPVLQSNFNIISVRPDFNEKQDYDFTVVIDDSLIYFNIYSNFYSAKYPVFAVLNHKLEVERVLPDINELVAYSKSLIPKE